MQIVMDRRTEKSGGDKLEQLKVIEQAGEPWSESEFEKCDMNNSDGNQYFELAGGSGRNCQEIRRE